MRLKSENDKIITFRGKDTDPANVSIPEALLYIQEVWKEKADAYGDVGSCVLGAGFRLRYLGTDYFMPPASKWKGSSSWEHCVEEIAELLKMAGAYRIKYERGNMD